MTKDLLQVVLLSTVGLVLPLPWYVPTNHGFWLSINVDIFYFFNQRLVESRAFLWLAALTNNRVFDGYPLLVMGMLTLGFWLKENAPSRRRIAVTGLVTPLTAVVLNQLSQALIPIKQASPTLTFTDTNRISELLSVPTRDASQDGFPGDYDMVLPTFLAFMWCYLGKVAGFIALTTSVVFVFPRVVVGTYWFTDIIVGSMTVILIGSPWVLLTSLSDRLTIFFDKSLPGGNKYLQNK